MRSIHTCKDCQERHPACHDTCIRYIEAKEKETERLKKCFLGIETDRQMIAYYIADKQKRRKR